MSRVSELLRGKVEVLKIEAVSIGDLVEFQSREQRFQIKYLTDYISGGR